MSKYSVLFIFLFFGFSADLSATTSSESDDDPCIALAAWCDKVRDTVECDLLYRECYDHGLTPKLPYDDWIKGCEDVVGLNIVICLYIRSRWLNG